nr:MAG TPA: hypothetical protein [Crassvirales sp.]
MFLIKWLYLQRKVFYHIRIIIVVKLSYAHCLYR